MEFDEVRGLVRFRTPVLVSHALVTGQRVLHSRPSASAHGYAPKSSRVSLQTSRLPSKRMWVHGAAVAAAAAAAADRMLTPACCSPLHSRS